MTPEISSSAQDRSNEDARLIERMAQGDKSAFAQIYDRFSRPMFSTASRVLNDAAEAQDVVHDVFITLWEKAATFSSARGSAFGWAVTLVRNRAIDRLRMRRRHGEILANSQPHELGLENSSAGSADEKASLGDQAQVVRSAVESLPAEQKRAVELAFFGGLTQQQIAEKLQEPLGTIKARIRRALLKLKEALPRKL